MPKNIKYLNDSDPWMLAEDIPDIDFFFSEIWLSSFVNNLKGACGKNYKKILAIWRPKFHENFYYGKKDSLAFEEYLVSKLIKDRTFGSKINKNIVKYADELRSYCEKINKTDLTKLSNRRLASVIDAQDKIHTRLYQWGWLPNATDMFHGTFTEKLRGYLAKKVPAEKVNEAMSILTMPSVKSVAARQDENLLKIAQAIKNNPQDQKIGKMVEAHSQKYFYLNYLWLGASGVYTKNYFFDQAKKLAKEKISPADKVALDNAYLKKIRIEKEKLSKNLRLDPVYLNLFAVYADFMLTKLYRRYAQIYWAYVMGKVLQEAARRLGLNLAEIRHMGGCEIQAALKNKNVDKKAIKKRLEFFGCYMEKDFELIFTDKNNALIKGIKSEKLEGVTELTGQIGCLGKVRGLVRIINSPADMKKMKTGDILISIATNPDLVPAMKKAAAFVTEQGGVTSHAAIVARELKKPCVIGTKIATKVFKDGDLVEVDANKGTVKKLK